MVSPISAARSFPPPGAARHGERVGTNLLPRASSRAPLWEPGSRAAGDKGDGLPLRRPPAARTSGARELAGASPGGLARRGGLAHLAAAGGLHVGPPPRPDADGAADARPGASRLRGVRAGRSLGRARPLRVRFRGSASPLRRRRRPLSGCGPAGTGTRGWHSPSAATRTAGPGVPGLWNRPRTAASRSSSASETLSRFCRGSRRTARGTSRRNSLWRIISLSFKECVVCRPGRARP